MVPMVAAGFRGARRSKFGKGKSVADFFNWQDSQLDPRVWHAALCQPGRVAHPQCFTTGSLIFFRLFPKRLISGSPADLFDSYPRVRQASWELDETCCREYDWVDSNGKVEFSEALLVKPQTVDHAEPPCQWVSKDLSAKWHNLANFAARFGKDWLCQNSGTFSFKNCILPLKLGSNLMDNKLPPCQYSTSFWRAKKLALTTGQCRTVDEFPPRCLVSISSW